MNTDFPLRDYQEAAHDSALRCWGIEPWWVSGDVYRSILLNLCTNAGKTIIVAKLIETLVGLGFRCLILADTDEICNQAVRKIRTATGITPSIEKAGERADLTADVVMSSAQTMGMAKRMERFPSDHFDFIFIDEVHRGTHRAARINAYFRTARTCGMTATAFRANLADLSDFYETVAFELGTFDLIDRGYNTPIKVLTLPVTVDISGVKQSMGVDGDDWNAGELENAIEPYFDSIIEHIRERAATRQILAFLPLIKTSQKFVGKCLEHGILARHVDGTYDDREEILMGFEYKHFQLLSNAMLLSTGWDCPTVDTLLNLRPTQSAGLFRQMVGRILRVLPGVVDGLATAEERRAAIAASAKPDAWILDMLWQTEKFKLAGPASLIAVNEEEAEELARRTRRIRTPEDLAEVRAALQAEREDKLRRLLDEAARRKSLFMDARLVGVLLHSDSIMEFEPTMRWHRDPVSEGQRTVLQRHGIDLEGVKGKGHAAAIMDVIFSRKTAGLASLDAVKALKDAGVADPLKMTGAQAQAMLGDKLPVTFGKHRGKAMAELPDGYVRWLAEQDWVEKFSPPLFSYVKNRVDAQSGLGL